MDKISMELLWLILAITFFVIMSLYLVTKISDIFAFKKLYKEVLAIPPSKRSLFLYKLKEKAISYKRSMIDLSKLLSDDEKSKSTKKKLLRVSFDEKINFINSVENKLIADGHIDIIHSENNNNNLQDSSDILDKLNSLETEIKKQYNPKTKIIISVLAGVITFLITKSIEIQGLVPIILSLIIMWVTFFTSFLLNN
ncbi:hypothetical protein [Candidatus Venteria ishoeyi]|uniref:Uncharacterized protein n=1 Tax=Candidatus Venteria ishoeyi TaxID=1899563 RepID=A0A1H6F5R0_9GAMM|nr:hypothetical protein [Candidatus Venteria ishoeyi]SEH05508.1 Uncharacterised protein [Candidatus Venteria ishoeyi]